MSENLFGLTVAADKGLDDLQCQRLLSENRRYQEVMLQYRCALKALESRLEILNEEFSLQHDRNPIESMKSRLKSPSSIMNKMQKRGLSLDFPTMQANIMDVAGVRVICSFEEDVFFLAKCLKDQSDIEIITEKDYISHPKPNGYRSLHLTIRLPVFFAEKEIHVPVEIQLRTIAMDFWASLEHTIRYKKNLPINAEIEIELKECADSSREWDGKMEHLLHILTEWARYKRTSIHFRCLSFYIQLIYPEVFRSLCATFLIRRLKRLHHRSNRKLVVRLGQILELDAILFEFSLKSHERGNVPADPRGVAGEDRANALTLGFVQQEAHDAFRMDAGDAVCRNRSSHLIALVLRIAFQLFPLICRCKLIRTGNADIKKYFHLASPSDVVRKSLNFQTISMLSRS